MGSADSLSKATEDAYYEYARETLTPAPSYKMLSGAEQVAWRCAVEKAREPLVLELQQLRKKLGHIAVALGEMSDDQR